MSARKPVTFPLPFARKAAPAREISECRPADNEPILFVVSTRTLIELLRYRIRNLDRPLGHVPEGADLN